MIKNTTLIITGVLAFFLFSTTKSFAIDVSFSPPPAQFYAPVMDSSDNVYNKALLIHQRDENRISMLLCRSDTIVQNGVEYEPIIYVGFVDMTGQPDYYAIKGLSITSGANGNFYSRCAGIAHYDFATDVWNYHQTVSWNPTVRIGTGFGIDMCPYDLSSLLAVQDLYGFYYNPLSTSKSYSVSKCSDSPLNFTISPYSFRAFARGVWELSEPILPIAGPPELKEFILEYYTEDYSSPKYIQATSDEPCVVDWTYGIAGYYDLICPSVDFNLGDSSVPSLVITNDTFTIYIPNTSSPCSHIRSLNYNLFDTNGTFLCSPKSSPISESNNLPQIPMIDPIPPEADWGAFDFLKTPINYFIGAINQFSMWLNKIISTVLGWFLPNTDSLRIATNRLKDSFGSKIPVEQLKVGFNNLKESLTSETTEIPPDVTGTIMGITVPFVKWDIVNDNITLIRNILNAIFYLSLVLLLSKIGREALANK